MVFPSPSSGWAFSGLLKDEGEGGKSWDNYTLPKVDRKIYISRDILLELY